MFVTGSFYGMAAPGRTLPPHWGGSTNHFQTHYNPQGSSGRVISPTQRHLPDNTQRSQETNIHVHGGFRTLIPSKRAAADPRLRPRVHWDRYLLRTRTLIFRTSFSCLSCCQLSFINGYVQCCYLGEVLYELLSFAVKFWEECNAGCVMWPLLWD